MGSNAPALCLSRHGQPQAGGVGHLTPAAGPGAGSQLGAFGPAGTAAVRAEQPLICGTRRGARCLCICGIQRKRARLTYRVSPFHLNHQRQRSNML